MCRWGTAVRRSASSPAGRCSGPAGRELEGRKEHLMALMQVVLPYARHLISGVDRPVGGARPAGGDRGNSGGGHRLQLRSSQPDTPPLEVRLDDAELADLVRVLDQVRLDGRVTLRWWCPNPSRCAPASSWSGSPCVGGWRRRWEGSWCWRSAPASVWLVPPPAPLKPLAAAEPAAPAAAP